MSVLTLSAKLDRTDGSTPWGFRMHGGKDFSAPLTIQRVTPGSLAAKCGLLVGDAITKIGGVSTDSLRHKEAQQKIMVAGNSLELTLQRGSSSTYKASDSVSAPYYSGTPQSPVNQYAPAPGAIPPAQNHNVKPKPFVTPVSGTVRVAVTTHNTPISMYSVDNVMDSLYTKANNLNIGPSQQAGSTVSSADTLRSAHEPQSAGQHDEFATVPPPAKFTLPAPTNKPPAPPALPTTVTAPSSACNQNQNDKLDAATTRGFTIPSSSQSRSFKILQGLVSSEEDMLAENNTSDVSQMRDARGDSPSLHSAKAPAESCRVAAPAEIIAVPRPTLKVSSNFNQASVKTNVTPTAYQPPNGNAAANVPPAQRDIASFGLAVSQVATEKLSPKLQRKSAGYKPVAPPAAAAAAPNNQSRTLNVLQKQLDSPASPPIPSPSAINKPGPAVWTPKVPTGPRKMKVGRRGEARNMSASSGGRIPICEGCGITIRGPFVLALEKTWCPDHFLCANPSCRQPLIEVGFVEEQGQLYCEKDYEQYLAPRCGKCGGAIIGAIVSALNDNFHPQCFLCAHCHQPIGGCTFHMESGQPYCDRDWASLFQTKCYGCQYPIEPGDRWVEALNQNWHSECFNCSTCQVNLEGQSFFAKGGHPYCKKHASAGRF